MNRVKQNSWRALQGKKLVRTMPEVIDNFQHYVDTYNGKECSAEDYTDKMYMEDMLYGIGFSLSEDYRYRDGFDMFKKLLLEHLTEDLKGR